MNEHTIEKAIKKIEEGTIRFEYGEYTVVVCREFTYPPSRIVIPSKGDKPYLLQSKRFFSLKECAQYCLELQPDLRRWQRE